MAYKVKWLQKCILNAMTLIGSNFFSQSYNLGIGDSFIWLQKYYISVQILKMLKIHHIMGNLLSGKEQISKKDSIG